MMTYKQAGWFITIVVILAFLGAVSSGEFKLTWILLPFLALGIALIKGWIK
jgi:hypothetical protein